MMLDTLDEHGSLDQASVNVSQKLESFNDSFKSSTKPENGVYYDASIEALDGNINTWLGLDETIDTAPLRVSTRESVKIMYEGTVNADGNKTLGLKEISEWRINPGYEKSNISQHAGYAAEVIGTTKENLIAKAENRDMISFRADDLTDAQREMLKKDHGIDLAKRNDQYVDKVRISGDGTVERVQVKFVGSDAEDCFKKLKSSKYDKYVSEGKVDKIEIAKEYYDDIKEKYIPEERANLEKQIERLNEDGKNEVAVQKQNKLDKLNKMDSMLEKSTVSKAEAQDAINKPEVTVRKIYTADIVKCSNQAGIESGLTAAGLTAAVSTVDNVTKVIDGKITPEEAFKDVAKDTAVSGAVGYGTAFVGTAVASGMQNSSHTLIKSMGKAGVPAAVITVGIESYDAVSDYATGTIDGKELAYEVGKNTASTVGASVGASVGSKVGVVVGGAVGTVALPVLPGVGTAVGATVGGVAGTMVGSTVGAAVATEAYKTAVEVGAPTAEKWANEAETYVKSTIEQVKLSAPECVDEIKDSINDFAKANNLPFSV